MSHFGTQIFIGLQGIENIQFHHTCSHNTNWKKKEKKRNINDGKPFCTTELVKNALDSFLSSIKTKCQNFNYNLRPQPSFKV